MKSIELKYFLTFNEKRLTMNNKDQSKLNKPHVATGYRCTSCWENCSNCLGGTKFLMKGHLWNQMDKQNECSYRCSYIWVITRVDYTVYYFRCLPALFEMEYGVSIDGKWNILCSYLLRGRLSCPKRLPWA